MVEVPLYGAGHARVRLLVAMQLAEVGTHIPTVPWQAVVGLKQPALGVGSPGVTVGAVGPHAGGSGDVAWQLIVAPLPIGAQPFETISTVSPAMQSVLVEHDTATVHCLVGEVQLQVQLLTPGWLR